MSRLLGFLCLTSLLFLCSAQSSPSIKLIYKVNEASYDIAGFENRNPFFLRGGNKEFPAERGRWHVEGEFEELVKLAYLPDSFELYKNVHSYVVLVFVVLEDGTTTDVKIVQMGSPAFGEAAVTAVKQWEFEPGKKDGKPVKARVRLPMSFSLRR